MFQLKSCLSRRRRRVVGDVARVSSSSQPRDGKCEARASLTLGYTRRVPLDLMTREALVALGDAAAEAGWCFWSVTVADRLVEDAGEKTPRFTTATVFHATSLQPSRPGAPEVLRAHAPDGSHEVNVVQASHLVAARGADRGQGEEVSVLQPRGYPLVEDVGRVQHQVHQRRRRVRRRLGGIHRALARAFAAHRHLSRPVKCAAPFVRRD